MLRLGVAPMPPREDDAEDGAAEHVGGDDADDEDEDDAHDSPNAGGARRMRMQKGGTEGWWGEVMVRLVVPQRRILIHYGKSLMVGTILATRTLVILCQALLRLHCRLVILLVVSSLLLET